MLKEKRERNDIKFITRNRHKFEEVSNILSKHGIKISWLPLKVREIQSNNMEDIIISKVYNVRDLVDPPFVVEDTGLYIEALNGFPGSYASFILDALGLDKILHLMENEKNRNAYFRTLGALMIDEHVFKIFKGTLIGKIAYKRRGNKGFGYDPIFIPKGKEVTIAEMTLEEKNKISHRGIVFNKIASYILQHL